MAGVSLIEIPSRSGSRSAFVTQDAYVFERFQRSATKRPPHLEVELAVRIEGYVAIHRLDFLLERNGVHALRDLGCGSHCRNLLGG